MSQPKASKEDLERLMGEMEALKAEATGYAEQESLSRSVLNEFKMAQEGLKAMDDAKKGQETLIPLGGRIFVKAKINPEEKVLVGLGRGVSVEKDKKDAAEWVEERINELDNSHSQIVTQIRKMELRMAELNQQAQVMYMELQQEAGQQGE